MVQIKMVQIELIIYNLVYYLLSFYIMTSQLFKENIPMTILYDFLEKICVNDSINHWFIFSKAAFKKAEIYNLLTNFKEVIKPYYHTSKQYYIERDLTFIRFTTVIKQICHLNNIEITSKIVYNKSKYEMEYYIANNI